jgi:hypothetical protein
MDLLHQVWAAVFKVYGEAFPNICKVAAQIMVSPVSSVECERGFSVQNHIKSKLRNCLAVDTLDILMRLRLVGPHSFAEFDLAAAVKEWFAMRKYRHICSDNKPKHWHLLAEGPNSSQKNVYVMWDDAVQSRAGPTYAGLGSGGDAAAMAVAAADQIAAAVAEQTAAAAAQAEDPLTNVEDDFVEFRASLDAAGVLQRNGLTKHASNVIGCWFTAQNGVAGRAVLI